MTKRRERRPFFLVFRPAVLHLSSVAMRTLGASVVLFSSLSLSLSFTIPSDDGAFTDPILNPNMSFVFVQNSNPRTAYPVCSRRRSDTTTNSF